MNVMSENTPSQLADLVASVLDLKPQAKQDLLEEINVKERLRKIVELLSREIKVLELEKRKLLPKLRKDLKRAPGK